ncbi:MAG TPA: dienelactone hydrolase family protein [Anaerolineae bacterium]|jgi:carboxymethylenebutenolidase
MCYDDKSQPPLPPGQTQSASGEELVLTASDGNRFSAYVAHSGKPTPTQVIIYPDIRGLHQFYKELALRFAEMGVNALAIDYFGRTAGLTSRAEPEFQFRPHVDAMTLDHFTLDVQAGLEYLHQRFGANIPTFVVGFCMGGSLTLMTGTDKSFGFAGLVPFYSGLSRVYPGRGTPLDNAEKIAFPLLGLYGGADQGIPESAVKELDAKLDKTGVAHTIVIYPGAPHSFFDRKATEFADASTDAWKRVLEFVRPAK